MEHILSQDEVDALLSAVDRGEIVEAAPQASEFRSPISWAISRACS